MERLGKRYDFLPTGLLKDFATSSEARPHERRRGRKVRPIRSALTSDELKALFEAQDGRCRYCTLPFGLVLYKEDDGGDYTTLEVTKDHFKPYSRFRDNSPELIVLACQLCNIYKSDRVFKTAEDVGDFTRERMRKAGYVLPRNI